MSENDEIELDFALNDYLGDYAPAIDDTQYNLYEKRQQRLGIGATYIPHSAALSTDSKAGQVLKNRIKKQQEKAKEEAESVKKVQEIDEKVTEKAVSAPKSSNNFLDSVLKKNKSKKKKK